MSENNTVYGFFAPHFSRNTKNITTEVVNTWDQRIPNIGIVHTTQPDLFKVNRIDTEFGFRTFHYALDALRGECGNLNRDTIYYCKLSGRVEQESNVWKTPQFVGSEIEYIAKINISEILRKLVQEILIEVGENLKVPEILINSIKRGDIDGLGAKVNKLFYDLDDQGFMIPSDFYKYLENNSDISHAFLHLFQNFETNSFILFDSFRYMICVFAKGNLREYWLNKFNEMVMKEINKQTKSPGSIFLRIRNRANQFLWTKCNYIYKDSENRFQKNKFYRKNFMQPYEIWTFEIRV